MNYDVDCLICFLQTIAAIVKYKYKLVVLTGLDSRVYIFFFQVVHTVW